VKGAFRKCGSKPAGMSITVMLLSRVVGSRAFNARCAQFSPPTKF